MSQTLQTIIRIIQTANWFALGIFLLTFLYQFFLIVVGLFPNRKIQRISQDKLIQPKTRFAVVIPARNEENVLPFLLDSLRLQQYPVTLYQIFVIADNCSDQTAQAGRDGGAVMYERSNASDCTKGGALNWFFHQFLLKEGADFDACVVFDADNLVESDFLAIMDRHFQCGNRLCVGYRDSKNAADSAVATASSIFFWFQTRYQYQPKGLLGLPVTSVSGTGYMFDLAMIRGEGWNTYTLTEDTEFTMQQLINGQYGILVREARFFDEQCTRWTPMFVQRKRWTVGLVQTVSSYLAPLLKQCVGGNWRLLDAVWFLAQVPVFFALSVFSVINSILIVAGGVYDGFSTLMMALGPLMVYFLMEISLFLLMKLENKSIHAHWKGVLLYPLIAGVWGLQQMYAVVRRDTRWHPIQHNKAIPLDDISEE